MQVTEGCMSTSTYPITYRKLSCFCNVSKDWRELGLIIKSLKYYRDIHGKIFPTGMLGTKTILCSDELQNDVFDGDNVFLYIEQDTSKNVYDGALKSMFINDVVVNKRKINLLNVGHQNRRISRKANGIIVKYVVEYEELNSHALISFQEAIHYDSTYQKRFKEVEYQLIRKQNNKHEASIRYEDTGARFYLDVL